MFCRLISGFNPCAVDGVMCRTMVSVSWDGYLYDCDFNLAKGLHMGGQELHISNMDGLPKVGESIAVADHCYTCTAGSGFTWVGAIESWVQLQFKSLRASDPAQCAKFQITSIYLEFDAWDSKDSVNGYEILIPPIDDGLLKSRNLPNIQHWHHCNAPK